MARNLPTDDEEITIQIGEVVLNADFRIPEGAASAIVFAHGSGSSRKSPRNRYVAQILQQSGFATLLLDLLTLDEERADRERAHLRYDIPFLANRLVEVTRWVEQHPVLGKSPIGYFGASTGAGAALMAAARLPDAVGAIVSRGGRPDLAASTLPNVKAPTVLIVGKREPTDSGPLCVENRSSAGEAPISMRCRFSSDVFRACSQPWIRQRRGARPEDST